MSRQEFQNPLDRLNCPVVNFARGFTAEAQNTVRTEFHFKYPCVVPSTGHRVCDALFCDRESPPPQDALQRLYVV